MNLNISNIKLGVIGCGKMASAILEGVYNNKFISDISIYDVNKDASTNLNNKFGFNICDSIQEIFKTCNVMLLATKPFVINDVMNEIKKYYNNQLIMSILAGVKIEKYKSFIENIKIIRIMPNTPALVNEGMSAICADNNLSEEDINFALKFMNNCGKAIKTTEDKMDIITALSGSGPAFYYKIIDLMAHAASKLGLNYKEAILLSSQTAFGSAKMVFENNFDIETLIKNVTTPGGCTEVGNNVLNNSNLNEIINKTIKDTMQKAHDLG